MKEFLYPSKYVLIVTIVVVIISIYIIFAYKDNITIPIFLLLLNIYLFLSYPIYISKSDESVILYRLRGKAIFKKSEFNIYKINKNDLSNSIRTFASGGLFGYQGYFYSSKLGHFKMIAVNLNNLSIFENKSTGKNIVLNY